MNIVFFSFLVTFIAGLSTLLGLIPIYFKIKNINILISLSLAYATDVMLSVSINSLLIESFNLTNNLLSVILFVLVGILISKIINKILKNIDNKLYKLGIMNSIALMIHNIPEGILTFSTTTININLGLQLALSIIFHNIPEGISISVPIYYSTNSKKKAWFYTIISGFSEFLGALLTYIFMYRYINDSFIGIILALTTGIMIYISLVELVPNSLSYKQKKITYISFIIGYIFMLFFK